MAELTAKSTLSVGAKLEAAGEVLQQVTSSRSTYWNVESPDPVERTARATERQLALDEASSAGIDALVTAAQKDHMLVMWTVVLTVVITLLTGATLLVAILK
jgi:hypothetical protein